MLKLGYFHNLCLDTFCVIGLSHDQSKDDENPNIIHFISLEFDEKFIDDHSKKLYRQNIHSNGPDK